MTIMQSYKAGEVLTDPAQQPAVELSTNLREVSRTVPGSMLMGRFQQGEGPSSPGTVYLREAKVR